MIDTALSHALVPPIDHETINWKAFIFLYIEQTQLLDVLMLFYAITYVRRPQIISFDTMAAPLDSCIVGLWHPPPPKKNKKFVFKSVKKCQFLTEIWNNFTAQKSPYLRPQSPSENSQISLSGSKKISHVWTSRHVRLSIPIFFWLYGMSHWESVLRHTI